MEDDFKIIDEQYESGQLALRSYVIGFVLSIVLTLIPYFIVVNRMFDDRSMVVAAVTFGVTQLVVQVVFFLHLHKKLKPRWNMVVFMFTILIVSVLVVGSLWIMANLDHNTMHASPATLNEGYIPQ